ncbi:MAG: hypothetical protein KIT43_02295 [Bauldia sp.]|nr:hypothetical protein [Bauldia sp.]MCW5719033.1 hypothetical protein [Bauldia sp.]
MPVDRSRFNAGVQIQSALLTYADGHTRVVVGVAARRLALAARERGDEATLMDFLRDDLARRGATPVEALPEEAFERAERDGTARIEYRLEAGLKGAAEPILDGDREVAAIDANYLVTLTRRSDA